MAWAVAEQTPATAVLRFQQDVVRIVGKVVSERDYPRLARDRGWQGFARMSQTGWTDKRPMSPHEFIERKMNELDRKK